MADGTLTVAVGASRSGKTWWVKQQLDAQAGRILVWDVEGQYAAEGYHRTGTPSALVAAVRNPAIRKIAFVPASLGMFEFFCKVAWAFGREAGHTVIVVEELADVTTPAKAPEAWGIIVRRILKYDCDLYAITQRPAESDKTIMGNAGVIHCCGVQRAKDRAYMAAEMDVPLQEIASLNRERLEYLHKDMRTGKTERGALKP